MSSAGKISQLKQQWCDTGLTRDSLKSDPFEQFELWYQQAIDSGIDEPNAMCLATVNSDRLPSQRTVLMKKFDSQGFIFFTNYQSRKARQIEENNRVSVIFPWIALHRQVMLEGVVEKISAKKSFTYFTSRRRESQLGAWTSVQSEVIKSRSIIRAKFEQIKHKFADGQIPLPDFWGGYQIRPTRIEFWQGRAHRLHDRFLYSQEQDNTWRIQRLSP